jgi:hypothetical protein
MCVAAVIEGDLAPRDIEAMDDANPHGAGVAYGHGPRVSYLKGLTVRDVKRLAVTLPRPFLLHFRWATHGGVKAHLTHPFPIGSRAVISRSLQGSADSVLIHNGVWRDYEKFAPPWVDKERWSDTAIAAYAAGEFGEEILDHVGWSTAVARAAGQGRLDITLRGRWMDHGGNTYSNLSWIPRQIPRGWDGWPEADHWRPEKGRRPLPPGFRYVDDEPLTCRASAKPSQFDEHRQVQLALGAGKK